jgi:hypothetical protein
MVITSDRSMFLESNLRRMATFEAQVVILAPSGVVLDILTDQGNYPVWNSGIEEITGDIVHGARFRVRLTGGQRTLPLRVNKIDDQRMMWTGRKALGLLTFERTFTVTDHSGFSLLKVRDTYSRLLRNVLRRTSDGARLPLHKFVDEVKFRSKLLALHLHNGIFSRHGGAPPSAEAPY